jgi:hypothetical protein
MKRIGIFVLGVLAAACGVVEDKASCASSLDCPAGQYCAVADGESRCWPDTVAPSVAGVTATCGASACLRDGVLRVEATATDDHEVLDAAVALDLDPTKPIAMRRAGAKWVADVPLRDLPFEAFERTVVASVTARDGAKTSSAAAVAAPVAVTRLRWVKDAETTSVVGLTAAAVRDDGAAVVGGANGKLYFFAADGSKLVEPLPVGSGQISASPAIGASGIWVGSSDANVYASKLDGSTLLSGVGVATGGPIATSVAVSSAAGAEWGFAASGGGRFASASITPGDKNSTGASDSFTAGPVITADGRIFAATDVLNATMRCYDFDGAFSDNKCVVPSNPTLGAGVLAPLAVDAAGDVWTASDDGKLSRTTKDGSTTNVVAVGAKLVDSPVIASNGDVIVGDQGGYLHRYTTAGASVWTTSFNLGGPVLAPMILAGTATTLVASTKNGAVVALRADGTKVWSGVLGSTELRAGNLYTPSGQTGTVMSTAYFPASNGKLYAVIVDGALDSGSPWPKAFHDVRNTNNAGTKP